MKRVIVALLCALTARTVVAAERVPRVVLFRAAGFPTIDAPAISDAALDAALSGFDVEDTSQLDRADLLVMPYGSAFPIELWPQIRAFLHRSGNLAILGGAPFHQPVLRTPAGWQLGTRQPTFAHDLLIGPAEEVSADGLRIALPERSWTFPIRDAHKVWELTVRFATTPDMPEESGSEGLRDAAMRPLVHLVDADGLPRACPLVEIDRLRGDEAGGRWIFATSDAPLDAPRIRAIVERALRGASEMRAIPVDASVESGEVPRIHITGFRLPSNATLRVRDATGTERYRVEVDPRSDTDVEIKAALSPGLYHVEIDSGESSATTAFWIHDDRLLTNGPRLTASRDWLRRDGKVFPVIGTTYMASDVHRKFLFEPNPHLWDADFARMQRIGINFVRTGIWTRWDIGPHELRALDAYVQTAAKHDIVVAFTFYAFRPQSYGGTNPYLDPQSLDGQRNFVTAIARRYRDVGWIHYDLINEPSYAPANALWQNRPIRDAWEQRAWAEWVRARHGDDVAVLRDAWQDASDDVAGLPRDDEIWSAQVRESRRPRKVYDFVLFTNDVVARWAAQLRAAIRAAAGDALVTLGQDEGGTGTRPSQQLHFQSVDYTSVHPWWQNDDVYATDVFAKVPEKPMLSQETGLMRLEDVSGFPWRSPENAARLLERKFAYAFAARGTGAVEWAWNVNPYMPIDNESTIGFFRPDGTAKPEIDVVRKFAKFFRDAASLLDDFTPDSVVVVIPQSRLFMNRPAALDGFRRIVRVLAEQFGVGATAISDLRLTDDRLRSARLIIVPSVEFLDARAADALLNASRRGAKIVFTGAIVGDPYGAVPDALRTLGVITSTRPVAFREEGATFDRNLQESLLRATAGMRNGNVWHEPLPVEHAREEGPLVARLRGALAWANVPIDASNGHLTLRLLEAPRATLAVLVNETATDETRSVFSTDVLVPAGQTRLVLFRR